tara:strand:+ start:307 stop:567 length:261 start_codon:yes stop_codon:yes gene_type:complete
MATYTITTTDTDEICMKTDVLSVEQWINNAVAGKVGSTKKRLLNNYMQHCSANEIQMKVTQAEQIAHARTLGIAEYVSEIDASVDK